MDKSTLSQVDPLVICFVPDGVTTTGEGFSD